MAYTLKSEVAITSLLHQTKQTKKSKRSKNNNKIAGIAESVKHKKRQNSLVLKLKNDIKWSKIQLRPT